MNYKELDLRYTELFNEKKYLDAIHLIDQAEEHLSKEELEAYYFILQNDKALICIFSQNYDEAIRTYMNLVDQGYVCHTNMLNRIPLPDDERLTTLKEKNQKLFDEVQKRSHWEVKILLPDSYDEKKTYPVFFNLHGDGSDGSIKYQMNNFKPDALLKQGFIVIYPQSSQMYCHKGFGWLKDKELSRKEIVEIYQHVKNEYSIDESKVIFAGFSGGANAVVDFCLHDVLPMRGFISLCPTKDVKTFTNDQIMIAANKGIRGIILEGERDLVKEVKELADEMNQLGLACDYIINPGLGHWYPENIEELAIKGVNFILES